MVPGIQVSFLSVALLVIMVTMEVATVLGVKTVKSIMAPPLEVDISQMASAEIVGLETATALGLLF